VKFDAGGNTVDAGAPCGGGGGGTVTSVGSGTGLTGGPITTSGTLSIDTNLVPQKNAANTFTMGPQTVVTGAAANKGLIVRADASQTANLQEWQDNVPNILASVNRSGAFVGPLGMLVTHASFGTIFGDGSDSSFQKGDGFYEATTGLTTTAFDDTVNTWEGSPGPSTSGLGAGLDKPGTFVSARTRWVTTPSAHKFYVLAGGAVGTSLLQSGFGFVAVGTTIKGFTRTGGGTPNEVDLPGAPTLTAGTWVDLLAIRRASSIEFYVNGVLRSSTTTSLPTSADSSYEIRLENAGSTSAGKYQVAFLTVGIIP
jgi:hypothetical protein